MFSDVYKILNISKEFEKQYEHLIWDREKLSIPEIKKIVRQDLQTFDCSKLVHFVRDHVIPEMFYDAEPNNNIPSGIHLPSENLAFFMDQMPWVIFLLKNQNNLHEFYIFDRERENHKKQLSMRGYFNFKESKYHARQLMGFRDGNEIVNEEYPEQKTTIDLADKFVIAMIATITNQNITTHQSIVNRSEKRKLKSKYQVKNVRFGQISWNILGNSLSSKNNNDPQYNLPLHWRRGYWRRAEENHPKSEMRPHALNQEDREKWWTWIDGYWAGHPAFGFKKSIYQPYVGDSKNV
jgi:hypothetical protein